MNQIYQEKELQEALENTNQLIASIRERKNAVYHKLAQNIIKIPV